MNFRESMYGAVDDSPMWEQLSNLFDGYKSNENIIPKKIHQIWLGGELPERYVRLTNIIKELNPSWEYKLWSDADVIDYPLKNRELYDKVNNHGIRADILRYEVLYNEGGIYLDVDFLGIKSFDTLIKNLEFLTGCGHITAPEVFNGLIGCIPQHPIMKEIIDGLNPDINISDVGSMYYNIGPQYFSSKFFKYIVDNPDKNIVVFPTVYFYCYPATLRFNSKFKEFEQPHYTDIMSYCKEETYVIHLWHSNWM